MFTLSLFVAFISVDGDMIVNDSSSSSPLPLPFEEEEDITEDIDEDDEEDTGILTSCSLNSANWDKTSFAMGSLPITTALNTLLVMVFMSLLREGPERGLFIKLKI